MISKFFMYIYEIIKTIHIYIYIRKLNRNKKSLLTQALHGLAAASQKTPPRG
jgi:hypothetical protein